MLRSILAVVVGFLVMFVLVAVGHAVVFLALELAFDPATMEPTPGFMVYALALGVVAALAGGFVAAHLARNPAGLAVYVLAAIIVVSGLASAAVGALRERPVTTPQQLAAMSMPERMEYAREPLWYAFLLPFLGGGGVLVGARLRG